MTLDTLIILAGALVASLPFLGFPASWDTIFFFLLGVLIVVLGVVVRRELGNNEYDTYSKSDTFTESLPDRQAGRPRAEHESRPFQN